MWPSDPDQRHKDQSVVKLSFCWWPVCTHSESTLMSHEMFSSYEKNNSCSFFQNTFFGSRFTLSGWCCYTLGLVISVSILSPYNITYFRLGLRLNDHWVWNTVTVWPQYFTQQGACTHAIAAVGQEILTSWNNTIKMQWVTTLLGTPA